MKCGEIFLYNPIGMARYKEIPYNPIGKVIRLKPYNPIGKVIRLKPYNPIGKVIRLKPYNPIQGYCTPDDPCSVQYCPPSLQVFPGILYNHS